MEQPLCELCGEAMPLGEEMFKCHGYSGPCPKPPITVVERPEYVTCIQHSSVKDEFKGRSWCGEPTRTP